MSSRELIFTEQERETIAAAVRAAEAGNAGEIVPFVVESSDDYPGALWSGAAIGAVAVSILAALVHSLGGLWGMPALWIAAPPIAGVAFGLMAVRALPGLRRALVGPRALEREVRQRAAEAFLAHEVFRTRDRTGILIFLSRFERRVVVLADSGIHAAVPQSEWDAIARALAGGVGGGQPVAALSAAIDHCGALLRQRRVHARPDDSNELPDDLQTAES